MMRSFLTASGPGPASSCGTRSAARSPDVRFASSARRPNRNERSSPAPRGCTAGNRGGTSPCLSSGCPPAGSSPRVEGATAALVPALRICDPGGPVLFLTDITDPARALAAACAEAERLGSPVVVADQPHGGTRLAGPLRDAGYGRHCDFYEGTLSGA